MRLPRWLTFNSGDAWLNRVLPGWYKDNFVSWNLIFFALGTMAVQVLYYSLYRGVNVVDISLWGCRYSTGQNLGSVPCPGYFIKVGISNPEGLLWQWLNGATAATELLDEQQYAVYTVAFFVLAMAAYLRSGRVPVRLVAWTCALSLTFVLGYGHEYQNLTIAAFAPLIYVFPLFGLLPVAMKLPIVGDFWNLHNVYWTCAFTCGGDYTDPVNLMVHLSNWYMLVLLCALPLLFRGLAHPEWGLRRVLLGF